MLLCFLSVLPERLGLLALSFLLNHVTGWCHLWSSDFEAGELTVQCPDEAWVTKLVSGDRGRAKAEAGNLLSHSYNLALDFSIIQCFGSPTHTIGASCT